MHLPRDVPGANTLADERFHGLNRALLGGPGDCDRVCYVLPSVQALLGAAWALEADADVAFAQWLDDAASSRTTETAQRWRYDVAVRAWASRVGAERVTLVLHQDSRLVCAALEQALGVPEGTLVLPEPPAPSPVEPTLADALRRELEGIFGEALPAELDRARVLDPDLSFGRLGELSEALVARLDAVTAEMSSSVQALGIDIVGDVGRLRWQARAVDVEAAAGLAVGLLEQVSEQYVDPGDVSARLEEQRAELRVSSLEAASSRELLGALRSGLVARARRLGGRR